VSNGKDEPAYLPKDRGLAALSPRRSAFCRKLNIDKLGVADGYCKAIKPFLSKLPPRISRPLIVAVDGGSLNS
jgi:hypothetical protein